jgi:hypothetical protein
MMTMIQRHMLIPIRCFLASPAGSAMAKAESLPWIMFTPSKAAVNTGGQNISTCRMPRHPAGFFSFKKSRDPAGVNALQTDTLTQTLELQDPELNS